MGSDEEIVRADSIALRFQGSTDAAVDSRRVRVEVGYFERSDEPFQRGLILLRLRAALDAERELGESDRRNGDIARRVRGELPQHAIGPATNR